MRSHKSIVYIIGGTIACAVVLSLFFLPTQSSSVDQSGQHQVNPDDNNKSVDKVSSTDRQRTTEKIKDEPREKDSKSNKTDISEQQIRKQFVLNLLNKLYADRIQHPSVQIQAIKKLTGLLQDMHPESWEKHVRDYLYSAFPNYGGELYDLFLAHQQYLQWKRNNENVLATMPASERKDYIWSKRRQFFGSKANQIWKKESMAQSVTKTLEKIESRKNISFTGKLNTYTSKLEDIYSRDVSRMNTFQKQEFMDKFLELESVQQDLHQMDPEKRRKRLHNLRRSLGFGPKALKRWEKLDEVRNRRWAKGKEYMHRRKQIEQELNGKEKQKRLNELRSEYFGEKKAETLKKEEESGFFRYNSRRVYGKN